MRNDDSNYVQQLERALEAAELEIKGLENELREQDEALRVMQEQIAPTHMGEPVLTAVTATQAFNILWPNQDDAPAEPCEAFEAGFEYAMKMRTTKTVRVDPHWPVIRMDISEGVCGTCKLGAENCDVDLDGHCGGMK